MSRLDPAIYALPFRRIKKAWMPGTGLDKPGHDGAEPQTS